MALPSYQDFISDPDFKNADADTKQQYNDKYWSLYHQENPNDEWGKQMQESSNSAIAAKREMADAPPVLQRVLKNNQDVANLNIQLGLADKAGAWQSSEERKAFVDERQSSIKSSIDTTNKTLSLFSDPKVDEAMQPAWQALTSSAAMGEVFAKPDTWGDTALKAATYAVTAGGSSANRDKAKSDYAKYRSTMAQDFGLTTDEVDDLVKHRMDLQSDPVSRDVAGQIHFRTDLLSKPTSDIEKAINDSKLPESVKSKAREQAPEKIALFKQGVLDRVRKDYPDLAADMTWTGKVDEDYATLTKQLNVSSTEQLGGGVAGAALSGLFAQVPSYAIAPQPGMREVSREQIQNESARRKAADAAARKQQAVNELSSFINSDKTKILGVDAATVGQGAYSVAESVAVAAATGGLGDIVVPASKLEKAGKLGKALLSFSKGTLNTAPVAGIYGTQQGFQTYEQALASNDPKVRENAANLAVGSAAIEFGVTTVFGGIGLGGTEDFAGKFASPALRKEAAVSISKAWKNLAKNAGEIVVGEAPEEAIITALNSVHIQQKLNPQMTDADVRKAIYDTVVSTILTTAPLGGVKAGKEALKDFSNITTHDRSTDELKREADDVYQAAAQEGLAEDQTARGNEPPPSPERVAELGAERTQLSEQLKRTPVGGERWLGLKERILEINNILGNEQDTTATGGEQNAPQALQLPEVPAIPAAPTDGGVAGSAPQGVGSAQAQAETAIVDIRGTKTDQMKREFEGLPEITDQERADAAQKQLDGLPDGTSFTDKLGRTWTKDDTGDWVSSYVGIEETPGAGGQQKTTWMTSSELAPISVGQKLTYPSAAPTATPTATLPAGQAAPSQEGAAQVVAPTTQNNGQKDQVQGREVRTQEGQVLNPAPSGEQSPAATRLARPDEKLRTRVLNKLRLGEPLTPEEEADKASELAWVEQTQQLSADSPELADPDTFKTWRSARNNINDRGFVATDSDSLRRTEELHRALLIRGETEDAQRILDRAKVTSLREEDPQRLRESIEKSGNSVTDDELAQLIQDNKLHNDRIRRSIDKLQQQQTAQTNATQKGEIQQGNLGEYPQGNEARKTAETGSGNSTVSSGQEQTQAPFQTLTAEQIKQEAPHLPDEVAEMSALLFNTVAPDIKKPLHLVGQPQQKMTQGELFQEDQPTASQVASGLTKNQRDIAVKSIRQSKMSPRDVVSALATLNPSDVMSITEKLDDSTLRRLTGGTDNKRLTMLSELRNNINGRRAALPSSTNASPMQDEQLRRPVDRVAARVTGGQTLLQQDAPQPLPEAEIPSRQATKTEDAGGLSYAELEAHPTALKKIVSKLRMHKVFRVGPGNTVQAAKRIMDQMVSNILKIHDMVPKDIREQSKLWYSGANKISHRWSQQFGVSTQAVAGVIAAMSPQKDWFQNVSLAERLLSIWTGQNRETDTFNEGMRDAAKKMDTAQAKAAKGKGYLLVEGEEIPLMAHEARLNQLIGKRFDDLEAEDKAFFIRLYDSTYNDPSYALVSPDGRFGKFHNNKDGKPTRIAWGSNTEVSKAIRILENPSVANISEQLGKAHKIRSFYNNIINPDSDETVTSDTHAVAVAYLLPLSGSSMEVSHNFGGTGSGSFKGTYAFIAEAYRRAAAARGIKPSQMQSITWEAVREIYTAATKRNESTVAKIRKLWEDYSRGKTDKSYEQTADEAIAAGGGYSFPAWYKQSELGFGDSGTAFDRDTTFTSKRGGTGADGLRAGAGRGDGRGSQPARPRPQGSAEQGTLFQADETGGVTPEQDRAYMDAVKSGDMETAQRMVDEAAKKAGYVRKLWHGRKTSFTEFRTEGSPTAMFLRGAYLTNLKGYADKFGESSEYFVKLIRPYVTTEAELRRRLKKSDPNYNKYGGHERATEKATSEIKGEGYDGAIIERRKGAEGFVQPFAEVIVFSPSQIKSADPVTYDANGNVIPLSQRFNPTSNSILYQNTSQRPGVTRGSITFAADMGKAWITLMQHANASTFPHELAHFLRRFVLADNAEARAAAERRGISVEEIQNLAKWAGAREVTGVWVWDRSAEEKFARGFERYLAEGKAPTPALQALFDKFSAWLKEIYGAVTNANINVAISPEVRAVFDKLMMGPTKTTAKPAAKPAAAPKPAPAPDEDITGIRREITDADRRTYGLPKYDPAAPVTDQQVMDEAVKRLKATDGKYKVGEELVAEIEGRAAPADPVERVLLGIEGNRLQGVIDQLHSQLAKASNLSYAQNKEAELTKSLTNLNVILDQLATSGHLAGLNLQKMKMQWNKQFELVPMLTRFTQAKRNSLGDQKATLTEKEIAEVKKNSEAILKAKKNEAAALEAQAKELRTKESDGVVKALAKDVKGKTAPAKESVRKQLRAAFDVKGAADRLRALGFGVRLEQRDQINPLENHPDLGISIGSGIKDGSFEQQVLNHSQQMQRGYPEIYATIQTSLPKALQAIGEYATGIRTGIYEHIGDLAHRSGSSEVGAMKDKIRRHALAYGETALSSKLEKEIKEQDENNAAFRIAVRKEKAGGKYDFQGARNSPEYADEIRKARSYNKLLDATYAAIYSRLQSFTPLQAAGRNMAIAFGMQRYALYHNLANKINEFFKAAEDAGIKPEELYKMGFDVNGVNTLSRTNNELKKQWETNKKLIQQQLENPTDTTGANAQQQLREQISHADLAAPIEMLDSLIAAMSRGDTNTLLQQDLDPAVLDDLATIGAGLILDEKIKNINEFTASIVNAMGPQAMDYASEIYQRAQDKIEAARKSRKIPKSPEQLLKEVDPEKELSNRMVFNMVRGYLLQGMDPQSVLKQVHKDLTSVWEDISFEEVSDAFTGYGKIKYPSTEEINVQLRHLRNVERIKRQLDVVRSGQAPKKTGFQRDKADAEIRTLQKELKKAMKDAGIKVTKSNQLKSSLDAIKTRFQNELEDLQRAINTRTQLPAKKAPEEYDQETKDLKARVDQKRAEYAAIFEDKRLTEKQQLKQALASINRSIAEEEDMLAKGILSKPKASKRVFDDPEFKAAETRLEALRSARHAAQRALRPRKSQEQIALDAAIRENKKGLARDEERVRTGNTTARTTTPRFTPNEELKAILAERESLKQILKLQRQQKARLGKPERDAARQEQRAAEAIERSLKKIEERIQELAAGKVTPVRRILPFTTPGLSVARALRDSRRRVLAEMEKSLKQTKSAEDIRNERMFKAAVAKKTRYQEMLDKGIYTKEPKVSKAVAEWVAQAQFEAAAVEAAWRKNEARLLWENKTLPAKVWSRFKTALRATGVTRLGGDLALLRHAGVWTLGVSLSNPAQAYRALKRLANAGTTERGTYEVYQAGMEALNAAGFTNKDIRLLNPMEPAGTGGSSRVAEEINGADLLDMAARLPKKYVVTLLPKALRRIEFVNTSLLNIARVETALALRGDPTRPMDDATRRAISIASEISSGRGYLKPGGAWEKAVPALNDWIFISTRYLISRVQMAYGRPLWSSGISFGTRAKIFRVVYLQSLIGRAILASLIAKLYPPEDDETFAEFVKRVGMSMGIGNMRDPNYGKLKLSNGFSVDIAQGVGPFMSVLARVSTGRAVRDGEVVDLRDDEKGRIAANYLLNRANLISASLVRTLVTGRTYDGDPLPSVSRTLKTLEGTEEYPVDGPMLMETAKEWFAPIALADTKRIYKQFGVKGVALWSTMMTGAGVQSYQPKPKKEKFY